MHAFVEWHWCLECGIEEHIYTAALGPRTCMPRSSLLAIFSAGLGGRATFICLSIALALRSNLADCAKLEGENAAFASCLSLLIVNLARAAVPCARPPCTHIVMRR